MRSRQSVNAISVFLAATLRTGNERKKIRETHPYINDARWLSATVHIGVHCSGGSRQEVPISMPTVVELPTPSKSSSSEGGGVCGAGAGIFTTWLQVVAVHPCKSSSNKGKVPPSSSSRRSELRSVPWAG